MVGEKPGKLIALTSQMQPHQMSLAFQDDDVTVEQVLMVERQPNYGRHPTDPPLVSVSILIFLSVFFSDSYFCLISFFDCGHPFYSTSFTYIQLYRHLYSF